MNEHAKRPRRRFSPQQKCEMVELTLNSDESVAVMAQRFCIKQNRLSRWIAEYRRGEPWAASAQPTWLPVVTDDNSAGPVQLNSVAAMLRRPAAADTSAALPNKLIHDPAPASPPVVHVVEPEQLI